MVRWQKVRITLNRSALEGANAVLDKWGISNYAVEDPLLMDEARQFGWGDYFPAEAPTGPAAVVCYFSEQLSVENLEKMKEDFLALADFGFDPGQVDISTEFVYEEDWAHAWKAHFHPFRIGRIVIRPSWAEAQIEAEDGEIVLELDPGMAFGSGAHPTTAMCLEFIQNLNLTRRLVWDIGTGSGILAMAAAKLGGRVQAVDLDPLAVRVARENRDLNGLDFDIFRGTLDDLEGRPQVITANITAGAIISMLPAVGKLLVPGGFFIASGIIKKQDAEVLSAARKANLLLLRRIERDEWVAYLMQRGGKAG